MVTRAYDPELEPWAALLPPLDVSDVEAARRSLREMSAQQPPFDLPTGVTVERCAVPGPDGEPDVPVLVFRPRGGGRGHPAVVYFHGGGFVLGDAEGDQVMPSQIVTETGAVVVSVDYRLAPECTYPGPLEDSFAALVWTAKNAAALDIDPARIAVGGVSAGAGLAAGVALLARDRGGPEICFQLLDIPVLDDRLSSASMQAFEDTPLWSRGSAIASWRHYLGPGADRDAGSPYAAPARAEDLGGLPPAYVSVCEFDPLRDEGIDYASRLLQSGIPAELHVWPGTFHGSAGAVPTAEVSRRMRRELLAALSRGIQVHH